jgi:hypothetical protein
MTLLRYDNGSDGELSIELYDNRIAAVLAWLWPGAGHFYQRRFAKGFLFMICILGTFLVGLRIGSGRVVYASFESGDFRWQYLCQAAVGLPSMPALLQASAVKNGGDPFWILCERYPQGAVRDNELVEFRRIEDAKSKNIPGSLKDGFMAPPAGPILAENDVLGMWHSETGNWFEIATFYTVIAGLLNLLAIYDAFAGPVIFIQTEDPFDD